MQRLCSFAAAVLAVAVARPAIAGSGCLAHRPNYIEGKIKAPISSAPGSAQDLTWTVVLPSDGAVPVDAAGPTFWFGGGSRVSKTHAPLRLPRDLTRHLPALLLTPTLPQRSP